MTNLKQRLEAIGEKLAEKYAVDTDDTFEFARKWDEVIQIYEAGFTTLAPLVCELAEALEKTARANERRPEDGRGGPEFHLSRIDIKAFSEMALSRLELELAKLEGGK